MTVVNVLEIVGESQVGWQDAVQNAVSEASRRVGEISGVEIMNFTANVDSGKVVEYKADVKIAYVE